MEKEIEHIDKNKVSELDNLRDEVRSLEEAVKNLGDLPKEDTSNNTRNYILLAVVGLALLALLIAGYVMFFKAPKKVEPTPTPVATTTDIVATTTATTTPITIEVYKDSKSWYDTSIEYPNIPVVKDFIMNKYNAFTQDTGVLEPKSQKEAEAQLGLFSPDVKYIFNSTMTTASSSDTNSYIFETYTFTGGAHGGTQVSVVTLDKSGNLVPIEKIIPDDKLAKVSEISKKQIIQEKRKRLITSGMSAEDIKSITNYDEMVNDGTKPTRENYSVAWYDGNDIVINFAQYQVGAYVEGMYQVRIDRNLLD